MRWTVLAICLAIPVFARAEEAQVVQWDSTDKSMADYIADGFELKAVTENYGRALAEPNAAIGNLFYLQKANVLVLCTEVETLFASHLTGRSSRRCFLNVRPHDAK
jgi:hypothetical protein